jgi:centromere/kinetochore protein ZW10
LKTNPSPGIGVVRRVERVEEHELTEQEGEQVTSNGNDWDTAWSDDEKETSNPTSLDAAIPLNAGSSADSMPDSTQDDEEADAWGWGDDEPVEEAPIEQVSETIPAQQVLKQTNQTVLHALRTGKLTEKYAISSIPKPVFETVVTMVTDGVSLSQKEYVYPTTKYTYSC